MLKTLVWKESRELVPLVVLALVAQGVMFFGPSQLPYPFNWNQSNDVIPFVDGSFSWLLYVSGFAAMALGFWQTLWESGRGTFLFLLHRPVPRSQVFALKLAVGFAATLIAAGLPILVYALWAAVPGTHASPFYWSMTTWCWLIWFRLPVIYLGAFLSGLVEGRWLGVRSFPLLATVLVTLILAALSQFPLILLPFTLLIEFLFLVTIFRVAASRDYS